MMKRRSFLEALGVSGAAAAAAAANLAANPASIFAEHPVIPLAKMRDIADNGGFKICLIEKVGDRFTVAKDCLTLDLVWADDVDLDNVKVGDVLGSKPMSWEVSRRITIPGVRVFGGQIAGQSFSRFAFFRNEVHLNPHDSVKINYYVEVVDQDLP